MRPFKATSPLVVGIGGSGAGSSLLTSLVGYWKLDEASGSRVDSSGTGNTLAEVGGTIGSQPGKIGNCTVGSGNFLEIATNASLQMGDVDFTMAGWFFMANVSVSRDLFRLDNGSVWDYDLYFYGPGASFSFYLDKPAGGSADLPSSGPLAATTWYFVVAIHDSVNDLIKISVNNGSFATAALSGGTRVTAGSTFRLGNSTAATDECGIWKRALSASEITTLYNSGAGLTYPF